MLFKKGDVLWILLIIFLAIVPSIQYNAIDNDILYNEKRLYEVGVLLFAVFLIVLSKNYREMISRVIQKVPFSIKSAFLTVFILGLISSFFAEFKSWAFLEVGHYLLMFLLTLLIAAIAVEYKLKSIRYLKLAVVGLVFFYLLRVTISYFLFQFQNYPLWPGSNVSVALFGFVNIRIFNHIQTWTLPLIISIGWYYYVYTKSKFLKTGLLVLITGWIVLVIASGGRGTALGVTIGLIALLLNFRKKVLGITGLTASATFMAVICYQMFFKVFVPGSVAKESGTTLLRNSSSGRFEHWSDLVPDIMVNPFLGYGPMHYSSITFQNALSSPHSWFLQFSYEWGLAVAFLLLIILLVNIYWFSTQLKVDFSKGKYSNQDLWIKLGLLWSLIAGFFHSFFSSLLNTPLSQIWLVVIIGMSIALYLNNYLTKPTFRSPYSGNLLIVISIIAISLLCNWVINHKLDQESLHEAYLDKYSTFYPRYWQQGRIGVDYSKTVESKGEVFKELYQE